MKKFTLFFLMLLTGLFFSAQSQSILCVDRDGSFEAGDIYADDWQFLQPAMDALGYDYEYYEVQDLTQNGPDNTYMSAFDIVFWFTGEAWTDSETMTAEDEFNLLLYTTVGGGHILLSAQDYLYDRYSAAGTFDPGSFPYDVLGLVEVSQDVWNIEPDTGNLVGMAGSCIEGIPMTIQDIYTEPEADDGLYIDDMIDHLGVDMIEVTYPDPVGVGAYQYEAANFRVIFSTASYAAIVGQEDIETLLDHSIAWLLGTTGMNDNNLNEKGDMLIYPNPVKDMTRIGCNKEIEEIWIINNTGQLIDHFEVGNSKTKLNTSHYSPGMYLVRAKTSDGITTSKMIVE